MRRFFVLVLAAASLPTGARALPILVAEATMTSEDTVEISLGVRGVDPDAPIGAVEVRIPTDASGYDVIGGEVLDPTAGALGDVWSAVWGTAAKFRSTEDDFFMSLFAPSASIDTDFEFALLTLRIIEPESPVVLDPGSTIARLTDRGVQGTNLAGQVIYGDPARVELPPPYTDPLPPPPDEPVTEPLVKEVPEEVVFNGTQNTVEEPPPDEPVAQPPPEDGSEPDPILHATYVILDGLCASKDECGIVFVGDDGFGFALTASEFSGTSNSVDDFPAIAMPEPRSDLLLALGLLAVIWARIRMLTRRPVPGRSANASNRAGSAGLLP